MKKYILYVMLVVLVFLCGCDRYWEKRINDFPNTVWISEEPYLKIIVDKDGKMVGETIYMKKKVDVIIGLRNKSIRCFINNENEVDVYFVGKCTFSKNKCIITLDKEKKGMLKGYDEIVLVNKSSIKD